MNTLNTTKEEVSAEAILKKHILAFNDGYIDDRYEEWKRCDFAKAFFAAMEEYANTVLSSQPKGQSYGGFTGIEIGTIGVNPETGDLRIYPNDEPVISSQSKEKSENILHFLNNQILKAKEEYESLNELGRHAIGGSLMRKVATLTEVVEYVLSQPNEKTLSSQKGEEAIATQSKPKQRVAEKDALTMLEQLKGNFKDTLQPAYVFNEDYAGGSEEFINERVVKQLIKKLTR
jgi:hypothetical protein